MAATTDEILEAFKNLSADETLALHKYADRHRSTIYSEPQDLLHEALYRSLDGRRNWPVGVNFCLYMIQTMRSIVGHDRERIENSASRNVSIGDAPESFQVEATGPSVEEQVIVFEQIELARKVAERVKQSLANDGPATKVLDSMLAGMSPRETCDQHGMSAKEFDAARNRVMRRLRQGALH